VTERREHAAKSAAAHTEVFDDECVVYDANRDVVHHLNSSASCVWECIDGATANSAIAQEVESRWDVDASDVAAAVDEIIERFRQLGIVDSC
jgi:PqqD family protein of HPr-rel-A system